jgi:ribosomal-protein-serine acetyltransferase
VSARVPEQADLEEVYALVAANREHLEPWMPWSHGYTRERAREWIGLAGESGINWVLVRSGRIIGSVGFHDVDCDRRAISLGYWIARDEQGTGIVTAAVRAMVAYAFGPWDLERVELRAARGNERSRAVAERCGFELAADGEEVVYVRKRVYVSGRDGNGA